MYEGSENIEVGKIGPFNVTIGCISPDARDLLDTIMEHWEKHYSDLKEMFPDKAPDYYGFAYWLVRWSGLIQPASNKSLHVDRESAAVSDE